MGRFTRIAQYENPIDYSAKLPEALLYKAAEDLNKKADETDALLGNVNKLLNIKVAPSVEAQTDYKNTTDEFIQAKNEIINDMEKNPDAMHSHNFKVKKLANQIADSYSSGKLKALKEQGDSYWASLDAAKTTYKDEPELFNLYKSEFDKKIATQKYNPDLNTYGTVENPTMYQNFKPKDVQNWVSTAVKDIAVKENIADIDARRLLNTKAQDVYALSEKDRITRDKIIRSLSGAVPQEFVNSFNQYNRATGYNYPDSTVPVDESQYFINGSFNPATRLGRLLESAVSAAEQEKSTITNVNKPQPAASSSSGSGTQNETDPIHMWWSGNSQLAKIGKMMASASPLDPARQALASAYNEEAKAYIRNTVNPLTWKETEEYTKNGGIVYPFIRGKSTVNVYDANGSLVRTSNNTFQPEDIKFDVDASTVYVKKVSRPNSFKKAATDLTGAVTSYNDPMYTLAKPSLDYAKFYIKDPSQLEEFVNYAKRFGHDNQEFGVKSLGKVSTKQLSQEEQDYLDNLNTFQTPD